MPLNKASLIEKQSQEIVKEIIKQMESLEHFDIRIQALRDDRKKTVQEIRKYEKIIKAFGLNPEILLGKYNIKLSKNFTKALKEVEQEPEQEVVINKGMVKQ